METYEVCLQLTITRIYRVGAKNAEAAVGRASWVAEHEDDVHEVCGGSAELSDRDAA